MTMARAARVWAVAMIAAGACTSAAWGAAWEPGNHYIKIEVGGLKRRCAVHVPAKYDGESSVPLVLILHGAGGSGAQAMADYGWAKKADEEGFVAAAPDAVAARAWLPANLLVNPRFWSDGSVRGSRAHQSIDDAGFINALIDDLESRLKLDPSRIFVTGFSSGASMTHHLGVKLSDRIAAIAPVSGHLWDSEQKLKRTVSMLLIEGTADPLNPLEGGKVMGLWQGREAKPPIANSVIKWVKMDGCRAESEVIYDSNGVTGTAYRPCEDGAEVEFYTIEGQGHVWPGGVNRLPKIVVGEETDKLNATDVIWEFFQRHPRR